MKTLVLVRHAKSSWEYDVGDRDRPLKRRGKNDAKLVAQAFKAHDFVPDVIYSSPANRAYSTCKILVENLNYPEQMIHKQESLYDFGGRSVLDFLKNLDDDVDKVMIFGHNHAFTSLTNMLGNQYIDNLPTSGLVKISFNCDSWDQIDKGQTDFMILPRELK